MWRGITIILLYLQRETLFNSPMLLVQNQLPRNGLEVVNKCIQIKTRPVLASIIVQLCPCREDIYTPVLKMKDPTPYAVGSKLPVLSSRCKAAAKKGFERVHESIYMHLIVVPQLYSCICLVRIVVQLYSCRKESPATSVECEPVAYSVISNPGSEEYKNLLPNQKK